MLYSALMRWSERCRRGNQKFFDTLQGSQFTSEGFTSRMEAAEIRISMDGKGRALDNIFVEQLWRPAKYEDIYHKRYETMSQLYAGLRDYFIFYNPHRPHQSLGGRPPADVYLVGASPTARPCILSLKEHFAM